MSRRPRCAGFRPALVQQVSDGSGQLGHHPGCRWSSSRCSSSLPDSSDLFHADRLQFTVLIAIAVLHAGTLSYSFEARISARCAYYSLSFHMALYFTVTNRNI